MACWPLAQSVMRCFFTSSSPAADLALSAPDCSMRRPQAWSTCQTLSQWADPLQLEYWPGTSAKSVDRAETPPRPGPRRAACWFALRCPDPKPAVVGYQRNCSRCRLHTCPQWGDLCLPLNGQFVGNPSRCWSAAPRPHPSPRHRHHSARHGDADQAGRYLPANRRRC